MSGGVVSQGDLRLLPGEAPPPAWPRPITDPGAIRLDPASMAVLATRALAAGDAGQTSVGVASINHGEGASTVARCLAECLAAQFDKRVVLVEANQRSPSLRRIYGLTDAPGLADVVARRVSLGGALQVTGEHRRVLVLPASVMPQAGVDGAALRGVLATLLAYADAVVVDLAPISPYRDTVPLCAGMDGMVIVLRSGRSGEADARVAIGGLREGGARVLGAVLNRERRGRLIRRAR
jgi:Mrp family chromosome partitioning ATPase